MKPRPSSSSNDGSVVDFSMHTPLLKGSADNIQQCDAPVSGQSAVVTGAEKLYILAGLQTTLFDESDVLTEWKVRRVTWPMSKAAVTDLANLIKNQACAFLHCGLDDTCGAMVVSQAFKLARLQRRANRPFLVTLPAAWRRRAQPLLDNESTQCCSAHSFVLISSTPTLLKSAVYCVVNGALRFSMGLERSIISCFDSLKGGPIEWVFSTNPTETTADSGLSKRRRALEEKEALGGLRNPRKSVENRPAALLTGHIIDEILTEACGSMQDDLESLGGEAIPVALSATAKKARSMMAEWLKADVAEKGVQRSIITAIADRSEDPDVDVLVWLRGRTPLGIELPITPRGIFPLSENVVGAEAGLHPWMEIQGNYASYGDYKTEADAIIKSELEMGRLDWASSLSELTSRHGEITRSRIAVVAKQKQGKTKVRLVHDLRRSGVNERVVTGERVVLPKATDVVADALDLMEATGEPECEYFGLDFADAFKQLEVDPQEQRFLGGEALGGFFVYQVLLFGIKSGPLLWGRVAALLMRITAAAIYSDLARLQCFVDDPLLVTAGTPARRRAVMWKVAVLWHALGFALSWEKGQRGSRIDWIGAQFGPWRSPSGRCGVTVTIPAEKIQKMVETINKLLFAEACICKIELRSFTGLMSWISNLCPQLNPFTRMLWAALSAQPEQSWIFTKQVVTPLRWLLSFTKSVQGPLVRRFRPRSQTVTIITFDGSPVGGGATIQLAVPLRGDRCRHPIAFYWATVWTAADEKLLRANIGDAGSQAKWEAFSLLLAVATWLPILSAAESQLAFCGDALGVLADALRFRAKEPVLNKIMAELALFIAPFGYETSTVHIWSALNATCDWLSGAAPEPSSPDVL